MRNCATLSYELIGLSAGPDWQNSAEIERIADYAWRRVGGSREFIFLSSGPYTLPPNLWPKWPFFRA